MIQDKLTYLLEKNKNLTNKPLLRNFLKEGIQDYILNFVYNHSSYKKLIFTGGTCLRKIYGLPRLSEDLDFDFTEQFNISKFAQNLKQYFISQLQYKNLATKLSGNKKTVFLKFPTLLQEIGLAKTGSGTSLLFVRCDFSLETLGHFQTEVNPISTSDFIFFTLSYNLPTLFANKIIAFLQRKFFKGQDQILSFKGRDLFDLVWFFEQAKKTQLEPNWSRVFKALKINNQKKVLDLLVAKTKKIKPKDIYADLAPFIESSVTLKSFSENFLSIIQTQTK